MRNTFFFLLYATVFSALSQWPKTEDQWYSVSEQDGIKIENSFPKGGPYKGKVEGAYESSYLVFFSRITNTTEYPATFSIDFPEEAVPIPKTANTFMRLFLPDEPMTIGKQSLFSYGLAEFDPMATPTTHNRSLEPGEDFLFYVVAFFYQSEEGEWSQERGGNRAELLIKGNALFYNLRPQVDMLPVGRISPDK